MKLHLLAAEHLADHLSGTRIHELISIDIKILPNNERLDCPHLQASKRIFHPKDILPGVLADFIKKFAYQSLLLDKFHIR